MEWLLVLALGAGLYFWNKSQQPPPPSPHPLIPGNVLISPLMNHGIYYDFDIASTLDEPTINSELAKVGAEVVGLINASPGVWSGYFLWNGPDNEPTENLPGIVWIGLSENPVLNNVPAQPSAAGA